VVRPSVRLREDTQLGSDERGGLHRIPQNPSNPEPQAVHIKVDVIPIHLK
jgi:hypothetical protein